MARAARRERAGRDPRDRPQIRRARRRRPGRREDRRAARPVPIRPRRPQRRPDRGRSQERDRAVVPGAHPARLRQAGLVPGPRPSRVRDEPAAARRRAAVGARGRRDRRERRRRTAGRQRGPDLPSSRRYLSHAVIGALALAETEQRRPTFEDMHSLLEPANQDLRNRAGQACADIPDLDSDAHFLRVELPNELRLATSQTTVRMDAPRNKISTLLQAAPIRRFLHHPTNVSDPPDHRGPRHPDHRLRPRPGRRRQRQTHAPVHAAHAAPPNATPSHTSPRTSDPGCR